MNVKVRAALILAKAMIESDREITVDSFTIRGNGGTMDAEEADIVAEYDTVLAAIDDALGPVRDEAWQRDDGRVTVTISGRRGCGKTACAHLFRAALAAIGVEALVLDETDVTHARMKELRPKVVIRTLADRGQTGAVAHG